jgi:hypothetical protein
VDVYITWLVKRDSIIEKQLPHWFMKYTKCLKCPLPFSAAQLINPFLNPNIPANYDEEERLSANGEMPINRILSLL